MPQTSAGMSPGCVCAESAGLGVGGEQELPAARRRRRRDGGRRSPELVDTGFRAQRPAVSAATREKNPTPACAQPAVAPGTELPPQSGRHAPPQRSSELYPAAMGLVAVVHLVEAAVTQQAGQCQLMVSARLPEPGVGQRARLVRRRPASRKRGCHTSKARQYDSWLSRQQKSILGHRSFLA